MSRAALAILSTENLLHNLDVIKNQAPHSNVIAMIKANGYGHGLRSTAIRLEKHVYSFGVASIDEALALRKVNIKIPITLMEGVFEPNELLVAACENFHVVFHEQSQLEWLKASSLPCSLTAWLKVDTGMGRLGFTFDHAQHAYEQLAIHPLINQPIGIMSHFACSDETDHPLNQTQINNFTQFIAGKNGIKSFCNSAAIFSFHPSIRPATSLGTTQGQRYYDVIRPGIALYGVSPFSTISAEQLGLKPVMTLQTRLMAVRDARKGSSLGYGARFICPNDMRIGVIAMGYGDGYPRTARDGTPILVNGIQCPLVGRVSMDMITVDISKCPDPQVNDPVVLWGNGLPIEEVSQYTEQCPYDMLTAVQSRVKFHWTMAI
jgi:alanine racemase